MIKKFLLIPIFSFLLSFSAQAEDVNEKCLSVKGIKEKIKCAQGKYIKFRDSVPKTGVETIEKLNKKK